MDKKYDNKKFEEEIKNYWQDEQVYALDKAAIEKGNFFSVDTPPPTVSGSLHIGHIFSYTQTDIITRYQRMLGNPAFYPMGFDDNGLPTERFVEKKKKVSSFKLGRSEFIKLCLEVTHEVEEEFKELWKKLGLSIDWNYTYSTISPNVRKLSQESFLNLLEKGFVYRKEEPALYCTACRTSVAQAELDDIEVDSTFNDIQFKSKSGKPLVISTTRPELLSSCVALFYNPNDSRYKELKDQKAIVPIFNYEVPILADESVEIEKGTGLVMCCTFGDKNDIDWYKKFKLPYKQSMDNAGRWVESTGALAGLKFKDARAKVLELAKEEGILLNQKPIKHSVNVHERCKKEIEYNVLRQWFINILDHKQKFIELADQINWYPSHMKARYINWVENLSWDWCISRQRFYGIPFPVWHCTDCNEVIVPATKDLPIDPQEVQLQVCTKCSGTNIVPDTDVMDTWNTSSITPEICYSLLYGEDTAFDKDATKKFLPMAMRPQAHDIIRTWAFDTIVKSWMHLGDIPWKNIVISGHVLSTEKEKISKSKGNNPTDPIRLLETYPADVIRFWTASASLGTDVAFSETQLKIGQRLIIKLWNAFRFASMNLDPAYAKASADRQKITKPSNLGPINEWLLANAKETFTNYKKSLDKFEFGFALESTDKLFWNNFCDNYLEIIKHQLFNPEQYSKDEVNATLWTLQSVGLIILQLYAPFMPYVTEAIYKELFEKDLNVNSIHKTTFKLLEDTVSCNQESQDLTNELIKIIGNVRKLKTEHQLALNAELSKLTVGTEEKFVAGLKKLAPYIKGITHAAEVEFKKDKLAPQLVKDGEQVYLDC
jgi:valyl-tRNA synthetase